MPNIPIEEGASTWGRREGGREGGREKEEDV